MLKTDGGTFNCLHGNPVYNPATGQWYCDDGALPSGGINTKPPAPNIIYVGSNPVTTSAPIFDLSQFSLVEWVKAHPFIVAGGFAALIYIVFVMGGFGKAASKVRTDITRWGGGS